MVMQELCQKILERAMASGFEKAEVYGMRTDSFEVQIYNGQIDDLLVSVIHGVSLRGFYQGKVGYSYTEVFTDDAIDQLVQSVKNVSSILDTPDLQLFYPAEDIYISVNTFSEALESITADQKIEAACCMEMAALNADSRAKQCDSCSILTSLETIVLQNSLGLSLYSKSNVALAVCGVVLEGSDDHMASHYEVVGFHEFNEINPEIIGINTTVKATHKIGATPIPSGNIPVILRHEAMVDLLGSFQLLFDAEYEQLGLSLLSGKEGHDIFSPIITITDDPHNGLILRSFDGEGVPTKRIDLVSNGTLISLMHNLKTAHKAGIKSTGHAVRSYNSAIRIGASNLFIQPREHTLNQLLQIMGNGLLITDLIGTHAGANPISGDFSLLCNGMLVENGKITRPVERITVAGNFLITMKNLIAVGNDLTFHPVAGSIGSPSIYVGKLSIAGD